MNKSECDELIKRSRNNDYYELRTKYSAEYMSAIQTSHELTLSLFHGDPEELHKCAIIEGVIVGLTLRLLEDNNGYLD